MKAREFYLLFIGLLAIEHLINSEIVFSQPAGSLDTSFNGTGKVITSFGTNDGISSIVMQPDGKILAGGSSKQNNYFQFAVLRYNTNGSLDTTFGLSGIKIITINPNIDNRLLSIALQGDGKILAVGGTTTVNSQDFVVLRLNTDGSMDHTFGNNGISIINVNSGDILPKVLWHPSGKIYVIGTVNYPSAMDIAIVRLDTSGALDLTYNLTGKLILDFGSIEYAFASILQPDGKLLITSGYNIIRVNDNAQIDSSFGVNGLTPTISAIGCLAVQPDGKILGGGGVGAGNYDFSVERFNDDGTIDSTFDNDGLQTRSFSSGPDGAEEIKIQVDGKILAGGFSNMVWGGLVDYGLMRLNNDGSFDSSFGNNGIVVTDFNLSDDIAYSMDIQPDLKIVLGGQTNLNNKWNFSLARYFSGLNVGVIDEPAEHFELSAYPNPASSYINLNYELANNATVSIAVYDVMGKRIKSYVHNETKIKGMQAEALAVDDLKKGVYILRIETERVQRGVRFVKN